VFQRADRELLQTVRFRLVCSYELLKPRFQHAFDLPVFVAIPIGSDLPMVYDSRGGGRSIHLSWVSPLAFRLHPPRAPKFDRCQVRGSWRGNGTTIW